MTRADFQQLPVERAVQILWDISERNGNLLEIMNVVSGRSHNPGYEAAQAAIARVRGNHLSTIDRFYQLDGDYAGAVVIEVARVHLKADEIIAALTERRDQITIDVIDAIMKELERLDGGDPFPPIADETVIRYDDDDDTDEQPDMLAVGPPTPGLLRRLLGRR